MMYMRSEMLLDSSLGLDQNSCYGHAAIMSAESDGNSAKFKKTNDGACECS